jgi:hypothetical protein
MSKKKIIVLQWLRGHCNMRGNEKALAKKVTLITENRDHGQKDINPYPANVEYKVSS